MIHVRDDPEIRIIFDPSLYSCSVINRKCIEADTYGLLAT